MNASSHNPYESPGAMGNSERKPHANRGIAAVLRVAELLLLVVAFGMLIPAVPSNEGQVYPLLPRLAYAGLVFSGSMGLMVWRRADHLLIALLNVVLFLAYGWLVHARVFM